MSFRLTILAAFILAFSGHFSFAQPHPSPSMRVELLSGQTLNGTLSDRAISINTRLGKFDIPASDLLTLTCQAPPHVVQTITTTGGDVLVGRIETTTLHLAPDGGAPAELPLAEISRVSAAAPPATQPAGAVVYALSGDKLIIAPPATIEFHTRWGTLSPTSDQIARIILSAKDQAAHRIYLRDGSVLSGLLAENTMTLKPADLGAVAITAPVGEISKLVFPPSSAARAPGGKLDLSGGDILRGMLQGTLTIQTDYGNVPIPAEKIDNLALLADSPGNLSASLNDGTTLRGGPQEAPVTCRLDCGVVINIPAAMITAYARTAPAWNGEDIDAASSDPAPANLEATVTDLVNRLSAAKPGRGAGSYAAVETELIRLGPAAAPILQKLQPSQSTLVQAQITAVIRRISVANPAGN